jgi:transposase-like protein
MTSELERKCPTCEAERTFYLGASTELHLGKKTKWRCPECGYGFVRIDYAVDTSEASG